MLRCRAAAAGAIVALCAAAGAFAAPGDLDPSFGTGGEVLTDFGHNEFGFAVEPEAVSSAAGKGPVTELVVAGQLEDGTAAGDDFVLARYRLDGTLDSGFGAGGRVRTDFAGRREVATGLAIARDGKIVAAGTSVDGAGNEDIALARYRRNGRLDAGFGSGGKVLTDIGDASDDRGQAVAIQANGRIVVAGESNAAGPVGGIAVVRYLPDGSLDASFGTGGKVITDFGGARAVVIQPDGRILVGGGDGGFALARYLPDGRLDPSFGTGGKVMTDFGDSTDLVTSLALQADGSIVAAGESNVGGTNDFALARYLPNGSLDPGFGTVTTDFGGGDDVANGVALQGDEVVAVGVTFTPEFRFAVARYTSAGRLDSAFGTGGKVQTSFGAASIAGAFAVTIFEGRIVAAGFSSAAGTRDFALAAYEG